LTYVSGGTASTGAKFISVSAPTANELGMAALAADGTCWQLFDSTAAGSAGTTFGSTSGACTAPTAALSGAHPDHW
jgi:hypothetical protein